MPQFPATFCEKTSVEPSGVNCPATCRFPFAERDVSCPEPSTGFTVSRLPAVPFAPAELKAMSFPSGDHAGRQSAPASLNVSRVRVSRATSSTHTSALLPSPNV